MKLLFFMLLIAGGSAQAMAQSTATPLQSAQSEISFQFERQGLAVPKFALVLYEDGTGSYKGETAPVSGASYNASLHASSAAQPIDRPVRISPATTEQLFKTARSLKYFNIPCESKAKNIANTGKKTLSYSGSAGRGSCVYNYSDNKDVAQITEVFQAIAFTMDEGRRLDFMHRYDRLGLYSEMDTLRHEVEAKRALELGNISTSLTSIARDEDLMEKVRERALALLNSIGEGPK